MVSVLQASACNMDTTPNQPHRNTNTHRTKNNTTNVVIQQNSRKFLMMDILMSETCTAHKTWNKITSDIKLVFYSSTRVKLFWSFPFFPFLYIKHYFNIPTKCASLFIIPLSITTFLHVSVCYIHHLQGEPFIACTKPSAFYCVFCTLHCCATEYNTYTLVVIQFFTMIKTTFLLVILNAKILRNP